MKQLCLILALILLYFAAVAEPSAMAEQRTVVVGVYENAPKVFTSKSGKPSGIFIDIIEQIAKNEGWELRYMPGTWAEGLDRLSKGEIDLMPDVAYSVEREKKYSFHKVPVLSSWSQLYARKGSQIRSILDLNGKRVLVLEHSVQQESFDRLINSFGLSTTLVTVTDYKTMFEQLTKGSADAGITNRFYGLMHAKELGLEDTAVVFDPSELFFAAPKKAPTQALGIIDRHLTEMKRNPQSAYYESIKKWTSEEVRLDLPIWLKILGLALGIVAAMGVAGVLLFKHELRARTGELKQMNEELERQIVVRSDTETALRNSEQKFMKAFHATPDAIVISRADDGKLLEVNEVFIRMSGYSREEVMNATTLELSLWAAPDDRDRYIESVRQHGRVRDMEAQFRTKSGELIHGLISGESIVLGKDLCLLTIIRDITERKKFETELEKHRLHLEEMVNERTAELQSKIVEIERMNRLFVDRELMMIELKKKIRELEAAMKEER